MATYTPNLNLSKPENTDSQQSFISDYCNNMDKLDNAVGGSTQGHTIIDGSGSPMTQRSELQFQNVTSVTDDSVNDRTIVQVLPFYITGDTTVGFTPHY